MLDIKKIVVNLSDHQLLHDQAKVLSKGLNFDIAATRISKEDIITQVETAIRHLSAEEADEIR